MESFAKHIVPFVRIRIVIRCVLILSVSGLCLTLAAQYTQATQRYAALPANVMDFRSISIEDGLSQGMVNTICQDHMGFMWIGTKDGLNRYDGYHFKIFRHDPADSTTISSSFVTAVFEDKAQRIWIGTSDGLDVYDRRSETFKHIDLNIPSGYGGSIAQLAEDMHGDIWVGMTQGLLKITIDNVSESDYMEFNYSVTRYSKGDSRITVDSSGWMIGDLGDGKGCMIKPSHDGKDEFRELKWKNIEKGQTPLELFELVVVVDEKRNRHFGVCKFGIVELDLSDGSVQLLRDTKTELGILTNSCALLDTEGVIWIPAYFGLFGYNPDDDNLVRAVPLDPKYQTHSSNIKRAYYDRRGLLWIGSAGYGILTYNPRIKRFNHIKDDSMRSLFPGLNNTLITDSYDNLLNVFDLESTRYTTKIKSYDQLDIPMRYVYPPVLERLPEIGGSSEELISDVSPNNSERNKKGNGETPFKVFSPNAGSILHPDFIDESNLTIQDSLGDYYFSSNDLVRYDPDLKTLDRYVATLGEGAERRLDFARFPIYLGRNQRIWCGGTQAFWCFDIPTKTYIPFYFPIPFTHDPYYFVSAIHEGPDGIIWIGTMKGLLRLNPYNGEWRHYAHEKDNPKSLSVDIVFSIAADPDEPLNYLWIGTNGGGLNKFDVRNKTFKRYGIKEGLPNEVVYGVLADNNGNMWMSTNRGLSCMNRTTGVFRNFGAGDGLQSDEFNRHAYCKLKDGRLVFGGVNGFNYFRPEEVQGDSTPVTVHIIDIRLMNKSATFGKPDSPLAVPADQALSMEIPYRLNVITFEFASMEYSAPERHRYQYKLEGFDPDWIDAGTRNTANYTNLNPGTYIFHVRGDNPDGVWNEQDTQFTIVVRPPWWMTYWFYGLCILVIAGIVFYFIYRLRNRRILLEKTVEERTDELMAEKERSDELLNNILPSGLTPVLKRDGRIETRLYNSATVLFTDFKDFTNFSENMSPSELVGELNVCFNAFDRIMEKYGIEKIKTIGDAYLAVGGIPEPTASSPLSVVYAALEMQEILAERRQEMAMIGSRSFEMRIGIHTGPIVAGIVGRLKFQYDIWGKTVDVAKELERVSATGEVNISHETYVYLVNAGDLEITKREQILQHESGPVEMFFVHRKMTHDEGEKGAIENEKIRSTLSGVSGLKPGHGSEDKQNFILPASMKILLVEDNAFNVMVARDELENAISGVKVDTAENGKIALSMIEKNSYDLVIMDVQMPLMDGYQTTRAIRKMEGSISKLPVIALSANVMKAEIDRCLEAGMDEFVPKPLKIDKLMQAIVRVLSNSQEKSG